MSSAEMRKRAYLHYQEAFGKNALIPGNSFSFWEARARTELDYITDGQFSKLEPTDKIMQCVCEVAELLYRQSENGDIQSESNDGYSVTYRKQNRFDGIYETAGKYLADTGILYRGFDRSDN